MTTTVTGAPERTRQAPRTPDDVPRGAWGVLSLVFLATVLISLGSTMLNIALPRLVDDLGATAVQSSWVLVSYMLVNTSLLVLMGQVADAVERRAMFLVGLGGFAATSLALGFAPDVTTVIALRGLQGIAAAVLLCNAAAIIASVFPRRLLNRAMGIYLAGFSIAQVAGPSLGGLVTTWYGWRWLFWASVPLGVVGVVWGWWALRALPRTRRDGGRVDVAGNALILVGLGSLLLGLSTVSSRGWSDPVVMGGVALFVVLLPVFLLVERRATAPAIDLAFFRNRTFSLAVAGGFLVTMPRMSVIAVAGLYFQGVHGDTPLEAAVKVTTMAAGLTAGSLAADALTRWAAERVVTLVATLVTVAGGLVLVVAVGGDGHETGILVGLTVLGLGNGVFHPLNSSTVMRSAPISRAGSVNAVRVMVQSSGLALATAAALTLVVSLVRPSAARRFFAGAPEELSRSELLGIADGYRLAFAVLTAFVVLGAVAGVARLRRPLEEEHHDPVASPLPTAVTP